MTHVEGPCMFWGQVFEPNKQQELASITDSLSVVCPSSPVVNGQPERGNKVSRQYLQNKNWTNDHHSSFEE
jgi:hypothetical protein